jgi:S1-C subfamily serine protease
MKKIKALLAVILILPVMALSACELLFDLNSHNDQRDYTALFNEISTQKIKGNVTIINNVLIREPLSIRFSVVPIAQGSGFIYAKEETTGGYHYYVLTNNHVIVKPDNYGKNQQKFNILDYQNKEYAAELLYADSEYDAAVLYFKSDKELAVFEFAESNPHPDDLIISLGQPEGQSNTITFGKVVRYQQITLDDDKKEYSDVTFPVITHDAPINSGSSGGALLNEHLQIVGLNYAAAKNKEGEFVYGYAVPVENLFDFFEEMEEAQEE